MNDLIWKRKYLEDSDWDKHWYLDVNGFELILSQIFSDGFEKWKSESQFGYHKIDLDWSEESRAKVIAVDYFRNIMESNLKRYQRIMEILNVKEIPSQSDF